MRFCSTPCTQIATVGDTNFDKGAAATVIANVDGTAASVTAALNTIDAGTLPGQVVGLGVVNAYAAAQAADVAFETSNKAAVDALAATLKLTIASGTTFDDELETVSEAANDARALAENGGAVATEVLAANVVVDQKAVDAALKTLTSDDAKAAVAAYNSAVANNAGLKAASTVDVAAVEAGLVKATQEAHDAGVKVSDSGNVIVSALTPAGAAALYAAYTAGTTTDAQRTDIDTLYKNVAYFSTFQATASVDVTKNAALKAVADTQGDLADEGGGTYISTSATLAADTTTLNNAKAADANKTAADALVAASEASEQKIIDAGTAINAYNNSHTDSKVLTFNGATATGDAAVKETFFFSSKIAAENDVTFGTTVASTHFGTGDSIVLGSGVTYNSGALSTGDNNKSEFFLVQKGNDTLVVIETTAFGSSTTTHTATGDTNAVGSNDAAVITLTGVAVADLTVNNGVISHVA